MGANLHTTHSNGGSAICLKHEHIMALSSSSEKVINTLRKALEPFDLLDDVRDLVENTMHDIEHNLHDITKTTEVAKHDGQNMEDAITNRNEKIEGLELIIPELEERIRELEYEVETQKSVYENRSEEWCASDVGVEYKNRTDQLHEAMCLISRAGEMIMGNE